MDASEHIGDIIDRNTKVRLFKFPMFRDYQVLTGEYIGRWHRRVIANYHNRQKVQPFRPPPLCDNTSFAV